METTDNNKQPKITLTKSQQHAFNLFKQFINSDKKVFILKGYAGTGKTTLLNFFVKELENRNETFKLLASTGRAAKIMRDRTGTPASTIHSTIYTFHDLNQNLDEVFKDQKTPPKIDNMGQLLLNFVFEEMEDVPYERCFYIVDEASMVSDVEDDNPTQAIFGSGKILHDLLHFDEKGKFVFVGDNCQLPPVKGDISPALSSAYFKDEYNLETLQDELVDVCRQEEDNDIVVAAHELRKLYENPPMERWPLFPLCGFNHISVLSSREELIDEYVKDVKKNGYEYATLICKNNKQGLDLALNLRERLVGASTPLCVNDLLLITQNNYPTGLMNGDMVVVKQVGRVIQKAYMTFVSVEVESVGTKQRYNAYLLMDILALGAVNITQQQQKNLLLDYYFDMKRQGFNQQSDEFREGMKKNPFLNSLRATYGYAITCHKSQGGEWKHVYLDIPHSLSSNARQPEYQWLYTAVTRAKEQLFIARDFHLGDINGNRLFSIYKS